MRLAGTVLDAAGLGVHDHVSWPYVDRDDFCRHATTFLDEGLALGLRVVYAAHGPVEALKADLAGLPGLETALARGALQLSPLDELYAAGTAVDPERLLATFAAATQEALAQGYAGLRIAADATALLSSAEQVEAFAIWEHKADRYMTEHPLSAMCGFDRTQVPEQAVVTLACLHPNVPAGVTLFRLYAADGGAHLALGGEVDSCVAEDLTSSLGRTGLQPSGELVVDAERLDFVDHRGLISLRDFAVRSGTTAVLRTSHPMPQRLIGILGLDSIRVESPAVEEVTR